MVLGCRSSEADAGEVSNTEDLTELVGGLEDACSFDCRAAAAAAIYKLDDSCQRLVADAALPGLLSLLKVIQILT